MSPKAIVVYCTVSSMAEAQKLAKILVEEKLAACVSSVPGVHSTYRWQEKIEHEKEVLLIIKTLNPHLKAVMAVIRENHSYTVPEIVALPAIAVNPDYLRWIIESIGNPRLPRKRSK